MMNWLKNLWGKNKRLENEKNFLREAVKENDPTGIRTSEKSQVEEGAADPLTRSPERKVYDEKVHRDH